MIGMPSICSNNSLINVTIEELTPLLFTRRHSHPDAIFLNALVYYKGELWAVDFVGGFDFKLMRWLDHERMETRRWRLFEPE
jgi:hypothetical protein